MSTSTFRDSAAHEQIGEAMFAAVTLQAQIKEFHERNARLPNATEAAALQVKPASRWVKSVVYDSTRQVILVTMAEPFAGRRLSLVAVVRGGELTWTCRNIDLPRALMRADCRD